MGTMETSGPAEHEPAKEEHTESESAEDEDTEDEASEDDFSESDHPDYEVTEHGETVYHTSELRFGAPGALLKNKVVGQKLRFVQLGAMIGEDFGVASATVREKLSHAGSTIGYGAYKITHPLHPARRRAAKNAHEQQVKLATDRRRQKVGAVRSKAAAKIAKAREGRIAILEEGVH